MCISTDNEICSRWLGEHCVCIDLIIYCVTDELGNFIVFDLLLENGIYTLFGKKRVCEALRLTLVKNMKS